jgi:D-galactarolactone cycloisomerase
MLIESIDVTLIDVPLDFALRGSTYAVDHRATVIVRVTTDEGVVGRTYTGDERDRLADLGRLISDDIAPRLVGRDLFGLEAFSAELLPLSGRWAARGDQALWMQAVSAVDTALWDTVGRAVEQPLWKLWGGVRSSIPVILIGGYYEEGKTLGELVDEIHGYRELGIAGIKLKVGGLEPAEDIERFRAVREAVGEDFVIACDANRGYTIAEAVEFASRAQAEELGMRWFEEPVVWYDEYRGMREVRSRTGVPVCAGQSEIAPQAARSLITDGCVDVLNFDSGWGGGPTAWRKVAGLAQLMDVELAHHEESQVSSHLLCSVPNGTYAEIFHEARDPIVFNLTDMLDIRDGELHLSDRPGLGLRFDEEFIARYRV